jgi:hypothetical protein
MSLYSDYTASVQTSGFELGCGSFMQGGKRTGTMTGGEASRADARLAGLTEAT